MKPPGRGNNIATNNEFIKTYGELRSSLLSRHFAFGRYFRANHLALSNELGVLHDHGVAPNARDDKDDVEIKSWRTKPWRAKLVRPKKYDPGIVDDAGQYIYSDAPDLQEKLTAGQLGLERWRVGDHIRENPLLLTGQLLTCLAVEHHLDLDRAAAKPRIEEVLATLASLYKFQGDHFDGYIIRWDPVTSDRWMTEAQGGRPHPKYCSDFLVGTDGNYLYSTPLDDPRYTPFMDGLPDNQKAAYKEARDHSLNFYRAWEPSQDELVGLVTAYDIVFRLVDDTDIRGEVINQVNKLGDYLAENGYLLVRPNGGFTARGASGFSVALEFPFGQVFERITGDPYRPRVGFEGALGRAGLWGSLAGPLTWGTIGGILGGALLPGIALGAVAGVIPEPTLLITLSTLLAVGALGGFILGRAAAIYLHRNVFDVSGDEAQGEFVIAYLLKKLPIKFRFTTALGWLQSGGKHAAGFPPFLGLTGLADADQTVRNTYLDWFRARRQNGLHPFEKGLFGVLFPVDPVAQEWIDLLDQETIPEGLRLRFIDHNLRLADTATVSRKDTGGRWWIQSGSQAYVIKRDADQNAPLKIYERGAESCFPQAVAVILGAGPVEERNLVQLLQRKYDGYHAIWRHPDGTTPTWKADLTMGESLYSNYDTNDGDSGASGIPIAVENIMPDLDYMASLALAWLHTKRRIENGTPIPTEIGFPTVPSSTTKWPPATIPGEVYDAAVAGGIALPTQTVPWEGEIRPDEIDVFGGAETTSKSAVPPVEQKPEDQKQVVLSQTFRVRESDSRVDTGIDILPEDTITFNASGDIWAGVLLTGRNGPEGWNKVDHDQKFPLHIGLDAHPYCLIAKIGELGNWMFVGRHKTYTHCIDGMPGRLYLRPNDDSPGNARDITGGFLCQIQLNR